jgi:hypothetical protein
VTQPMDWRKFENLLKTEARFFSRTVAKRLASIFDGIDELQTRDGRPLVVDAGPDTDFHALYRARVFQSNDKLEAALDRPDIHLGPPLAPWAAGGRINARGISVFYGANNQRTAIAELRPPVGSLVAVAQFRIIRKLRLLDLTALGDVPVTASIADFGLAGRKETALFLRSLNERITRAAMPDGEPFEYLATQAIADFLATEASVSMDGIVFPSVQAAGDALNVVLFHKAARVAAMNVPQGTGVSTGRWAEDGWVDDYEVVEKVSPLHENRRATGYSDFGAIAEVMPPDPRDSSWRCVSLRVVPETMEVHRIKRVEFATEEFTVKRQRRENDF